MPAELAEGVVLPVRSVVRNPLVGTTVSELRGIRVLSDAEISERFQPSEHWTILETTLPEVPLLSR